MIDQKTATKRAYDLAAEQLCEHMYVCTTCRCPFDEFCEVGLPLLRAENDAWTAYREAHAA